MRYLIKPGASVIVSIDPEDEYMDCLFVAYVSENLFNSMLAIDQQPFLITYEEAEVL